MRITWRRPSSPSHRLHAERGFMMVAILIGLGVAAIMMTAALPNFRHEAQRTREEELIFRGEQYARALALYAIHNRGALPMDIDALVSQHFLRHKWKDPITNDDFQLVGIGIVQPGVQSQPVGQQPFSSSPFGSQQQAGTGRSGGASQMATTGNPGISGVRSKSTATSIKIYNQQQQHNLWAFDAVTYAQQKWAINLNQVANGGGRQGGGPAGGRGPGGAPGTGLQPGGPGVGRGGDTGRGGTQGPGRGGGPPATPVTGTGPGRGR
jgi:type II secretory pathway pseudopilin PulG